MILEDAMLTTAGKVFFATGAKPLVKETWLSAPLSA